MSDILNRILARKAEEIEQRSRVRPLEELRVRAKQQPAPRGFVGITRLLRGGPRAPARRRPVGRDGDGLQAAVGGAHRFSRESKGGGCCET